MRFFIVLAAIGLANASGAPLQNFAFTTHGQGSQFTMMQKVVPQAMPMVGYAQQPVAIQQKAITITGPGGYPGYGPGYGPGPGPEMLGAQNMAIDQGPGAPAPTHKALTLGNTAFGVGAAVKSMNYAGSPMLAAGQQMISEPKGYPAAGPYAGISVGLIPDKGMSAASLAHGPPMGPPMGQTAYAPGPLGTFSPEKASYAALPGKGFVAGTPIEMVTAQKTFFAGPGQAVGYAQAQAGPMPAGHPGQAYMAHNAGQGQFEAISMAGHGAAMGSAPVAVAAAPAHAGYGSEFAFAEKIFASAPAGLYGKPYTTSPLATKSMMIK